MKVFEGKTVRMCNQTSLVPYLTLPRESVRMRRQADGNYLEFADQHRQNVAGR